MQQSRKLRFSFTFVSLLVLLGVSVVTLVANAQEEETNTEPTASETRQNTDGEPTTGQTRSEEARAGLSAQAQTRIENLAANMSNKMDAVVARFEQIIERLNTRIAKLQQQNVDTGAAQVHIQNAEASLQEAKDLLAGIDASVAEVVSSETPRQAWKQTRFTYMGISGHIRNAHQSLRQAVAALKDAVAAAELGRGVSDAVRNDDSNTPAEDE